MNKIFMVAAAAAALLLSACDGGTPKPSLKTDADTLSYELGMANAPSEADLKQYLSDPRTGSDSTYVEEFMKGLKDGLKAGDDKKQAAYMAGLQVGANMRGSMTQIEKMVFADDSTRHLSAKNFVAGFEAGYKGQKTALKINGKLIDRQGAAQDLNERIRKMSAKALEGQYKNEKKAADAFIAAKAKEAGVQKLAGGTLYKVITPGNGAKPTAGQTVNVIYEGKLTDGTVFDASAQHPGPDGKSIPMTVGQSIPGFDAALQAMPIGSTWEVYIPYSQAYNEQSAGAIKPFSALTFTITLVGIEEANQAAH